MNIIANKGGVREYCILFYLLKYRISTVQIFEIRSVRYLQYTN